MDHPSIIWPVLAFDADVVSWDLPEPADRGMLRHHVKSVAAWGVSRFTLDVVIALSDKQFEAAVRNDQRRKRQRADASEEDRILGSLKIDFSGLDRHGMYPASSRHRVEGTSKPGMDFFEKMEAKLPPEVDAMLLSAVGAFLLFQLGWPASDPCSSQLLSRTFEELGNRCMSKDESTSINICSFVLRSLESLRLPCCKYVAIAKGSYAGGRWQRR